MRTTLLKSVLGVSLAVVGFAANAAISGSAHDFSANTNYGTAGQICKACHAPHAAANGALGQLWNHTPSAVASYTLYTSTTMNAPTAQPAGTSKLCLSCHDGTIAVDSFGGATGGTGASLTGTLSLGTSLSDDHPIGMNYSDAYTVEGGVNGGLWVATTSANIGSTTTRQKTGDIATNLLNGGATVECASCHDVHNTYTDGPKLLKIKISASTLCITCHNK